MRHVSKVLLVTLTAAGLASAGTVIAYASWPVPSKPVQAKVRAVDMPQGVRPSVAKNGGDAVVTWSPQEIGPGSTMHSYLVRRHNVDDATVTKAFAPVTGTTFTDVGVPTGRWYWTVTPRFAGWTGEESKKSANLSFSAPEPTALVASTSAAQAPPPASTGTPPATDDDPAAPRATASPTTPDKAIKPEPAEPASTTPAQPEGADVVEPASPTTSPAAEDKN
jgi:hypothetical protein